ncbi:MAG: hypothetical protein KIT31_39535 [Deltaproteobacteria bacterium]|nr:hypothetical protein [Deltaproteobacteria bacterium]
MSSKLAIVALAVGCGGGAAPKESMPAPPPPPVQPDAAAPVAVDVTPKPAACLEVDALIAETRVVGSAVVACYQDIPGCWALDPATGDVAPHGELPAVAPDPEVTVDAAGIKVCAAGATDCKTIATKEFPEGATAVAKADRSLVAVATSKDVTVFDVAKGTRLARIPGWKTPMTENTAVYQLGPMHFLGDNLAVWESYSPVGMVARLFVPRTGKLVANIAGANVQISDRDPVHVGGASWAFVGFDVNLIYVHDVATGKLVTTYDLGKAGAGMPDAWLGRIGDHFVVAANNKVRALDTRTKAIRELDPPRCR